jgi:hypothetical protein
MNAKLCARDLFNNRDVFKNKVPISYDLYKKIILCLVTSLKPNLKDSFFKRKYKTYVNNINLSPSLTHAGFYSIHNTQIKFYLSRGWNLKESKELIKQRCSTITRLKLNPEKYKKFIEKQANTFTTNYYNGKHKKFYRPSQLEYWINKGFNKEDARKERFNYYSVKTIETHRKLKLLGKKYLSVRQLEYWINNGFNYEEAKKQLKIVCDTRSLSSCIERYGKKLGAKKFIERNAKWRQQTLNNKTPEEKLEILIKKLKNFKRYSKKSIDLFNVVFNELKETHNIIFNKIYMAENEYYIYDNINKKIFFYDLCIKDLKLIVEYNGTVFHPNKKILNESEWNNWINPISKKNANEQHNIDLNKEKIAKSHGFNYIVVWENETVNNNKIIIINKILKLYEKYRTN